VATGGRAGTRRELIARGLAFGRHGGDVGALQALARAEQVLVASYEQLLGSTVLAPAAGVLAAELLAHEHVHLRALSAELKRLGGKVPRRPSALGRGGAAGPFAGDERAVLRSLVTLERAALAVYYTELGKLRDPGAAQLATEIMACEAQHATALRELLYPARPGRAVPSPFVFGNL
jgi:rubrerythrin